jgi:hypothetical protein
MAPSSTQSVVDRDRHLLVVPDFFDRAEEMRSTFESVFESPRRANRKRFVWDYWHVPGQYTYVRTFAQPYFRPELWAVFLKRLRSWGEQRLGCAGVTDPWLSFYVAGCRQELHTDVPQGPWAYVFSLTRWDGRRFSGGETILLRPSALSWTGLQASDAQELNSLAERIAPEFNQLTVFDPRIPHGVVRVEGTWDPLESRVVIHGWFTEPRVRAEGAIDVEAARIALDRALPRLFRRLETVAPVAGLVVSRVSVDDAGSIDVERVAETLVPTTGDSTGVERTLSEIDACLSELELPVQSGPGAVLVPIRLPPPRERSTASPSPDA